LKTKPFEIDILQKSSYRNLKNVTLAYFSRNGP